MYASSAPFSPLIPFPRFFFEGSLPLLVAWWRKRRETWGGRRKGQIGKERKIAVEVIVAEQQAAKTKNRCSYRNRRSTTSKKKQKVETENRAAWHDDDVRTSGGCSKTILSGQLGCTDVFPSASTKVATSYAQTADIWRRAGTER